MSDSSPSPRPSRSKVWRNFAFGEPLGVAFAEWAYRTPRFPMGIKGSELTRAAPDIQRETMVVWFLANHVPATGPYFGFSEATQPQTIGPLNTYPVNTMTPGQSLSVGFGLGPFFNGGQASDLLAVEFKELVSTVIIAEVTSLFEGLWQRIPPDPIFELEKQASDDRVDTIVALLDDFAQTVLRSVPTHGGRGHNGPPDAPSVITEDEKFSV